MIAVAQQRKWWEFWK
ncbi:hypothetical protein [Bacillus pumilus]